MRLLLLKMERTDELARPPAPEATTQAVVVVEPVAEPPGPVLDGPPEPPVAEPAPATPILAPIEELPGTDVERVICAWPWDCRSAMAVAFCESTLQPWADNGISYGLFALWGGHVKRWPDFWSWWSDPMANAAHAYELYAEQGWVPWHPSSSCSGVY